MENTQNLKSIKTTERKQILVNGQVQGVGFRPFVYRLACIHKIYGKVGNTSQGVCIEAQGSKENLHNFIEDLQQTLPPLAKINTLDVKCIPIQNDYDFQIITSQAEGGNEVLIAADAAICAECMQDILDPSDRRHYYPFTNCTNCGPRYTITHSIPYDRHTTSMHCFNLCPQCQSEYTNPLDRRFHAQPNACPICGPQIWFVKSGTSLEQSDFSQTPQHQRNDASIQCVASRLKAGDIAAIKGLGGFHLCCDATNQDSIALLREHKNRPHKPLAVMVLDIAMAKRIAHIGPREEALLNGNEKPIVLCKRKQNILPQSLAPDTEQIGLVLPYTPLHVVLMQHYTKLCSKNAIVALVMTSGNAGGEPICLGNREALNRLSHIAQVFLLHNRDILIRNDDSVCSTTPIINGLSPSVDKIFFRRARGYVPRPIKLSTQDAGAIMGMGAELKSTICLSRGNLAFVSQHIGDLHNLETMYFYNEIIQHMEMLLQVQPKAIIHDLHPDFMSTQIAKNIAQERNIPCIPMQHHFAHAWSVLAEHNFTGKILALSLDGTGLGTDGTIWGGELLYINTINLEHKRLGRLAPFTLPGADSATKEPWRIALGLAQNSKWQKHIEIQHEQYALGVSEILKRNLNCPLTSSVGRLFDAVSAGLGLCNITSYEGQAAIRLEQAQRNVPWVGLGSIDNGYDCIAQKKGDLWELPSQTLFMHCLEEKNIEMAARRFHVGLAQGFAQMAKMAALQLDIKHIALSGGAMQNLTLHSILPAILRNHGFTVLMHQDIPCNDGGIALGQVAWGRQCLAQNS